MATVPVEDLRFGSFYYSEILQDLLTWRRSRLPELNDEDPHEPFVQALRAWAGVHHNSNVLLDFTAVEALFLSCKLRESIRSPLALIGYQLHEAIPAVVDELIALTAPLSAPATLAGSKFATTAIGDLPEVMYEQAVPVLVPRSDQIGQVWENHTTTYTDRTAAWNAGGSPVAPFSGSPAAGDVLYFGHLAVLWDRLQLIFSVGGAEAPEADDLVLEYYDGATDDGSPDGVVDNMDGTITLDLTTILGAHDRHGTVMRVRCGVTGVYEDCTSAYTDGVNVITTSTYLGQTPTVSLSTVDYMVGSEWKELPDLAWEPDDTKLNAEWTLPEGTDRRWLKATVNNVEAYWMRMRWINASAIIAIDQAKIDQGDQWIKLAAVQGETVADDPGGSSTGMAGQMFATSRTGVIDGTVVVEVDEGDGWVPWVTVPDFLSQASTARACTVIHDDLARALIAFGDGVNGKLPPLGTDNLRWTYRVGADQNGNVGVGAISVMRGGLVIGKSVTNPRPAAGWEPPEGSTPEDIALLKVRGPATLRTMDRALTAADMEYLAVRWTAADGSRPAKRAKAIEEFFGPYTVLLAVVGDSGVAVPDEYLAQLEVYFNGDPITGVAGVAVMGYEVTAQNYGRRLIPVLVDYAGDGSIDLIRVAVQAYLDPLAVNEDGTWVHEFGGTVPWSKLLSKIQDADDLLGSVTLGTPASDVTVGDRELPAASTVTRA